eukprot:Gregarina_sp_Poly_1__5760@NODE_302_length_9747_cov_161_916736_g261_i0_p4_GENE_NODE_302_length_9747_cov_161_916736_g261_i0NODE_302_length_9747_cov_161_916736_g261_i0_p4_ORF_typecomplete_len381_score44_81_NODE_302_length_9747_cov_161_916736_g261_i067007842
MLHRKLQTFFQRDRSLLSSTTDTLSSLGGAEKACSSRKELPAAPAINVSIAPSLHNDLLPGELPPLRCISGRDFAEFQESQHKRPPSPVQTVLDTAPPVTKDKDQREGSAYEDKDQREGSAFEDKDQREASVVGDILPPRPASVERQTVARRTDEENPSLTGNHLRKSGSLRQHATKTANVCHQQSHSLSGSSPRNQGLKPDSASDPKAGSRPRRRSVQLPPRPSADPSLLCSGSVSGGSGRIAGGEQNRSIARQDSNASSTRHKLPATRHGSLPVRLSLSHRSSIVLSESPCDLTTDAEASGARRPRHRRLNSRSDLEKGGLTKLKSSSIRRQSSTLSFSGEPPQTAHRRDSEKLETVCLGILSHAWARESEWFFKPAE